MGLNMSAIEQINTTNVSDFVSLLDGTYEHSPWITEKAWLQRPFKSLVHLKLALVDVVRAATRDAQLGLIRAHPDLAGKEMVAKMLTAESTHGQGKAGLTDCTSSEYARIQQLNADYNAKFGFPFILAVRGPRGLGLAKAEIIATFERRLDNHPEFELAECLRNIHRIGWPIGCAPTAASMTWRSTPWAMLSASTTAPTVRPSVS